MGTNSLVKPFLKWAGGKRYLIEVISKYWPNNLKGTYFEPFLGGGAVLFAFQPQKAVVNDVNSELINCYNVVKDSVDELVACLNDLRDFNNEENFYRIRDWDRESNFLNRSKVERAARIIFLNKTCYNGLFRVNSQGQFNVPFGRYKAPNIVDDIVLRAVSRYLNTSDITFLNGDFEDAVASAQKSDFIYFDPPYHSATDPASFTGYNVNGFGEHEQHRLRSLTLQLHKRKCKFLLSNSSTDFTRYVYGSGIYEVETVEVPRPINSNALKRGKVDEILVRNYGKRKATK